MSKRVKPASRLTRAIQQQSKMAARRGQLQRGLAAGRGFDVLVKGYRIVWKRGEDMPTVIERPAKPA
jgi:hypothetical protein